MFKSLDIHEHMEVVGSDGKHVGTVDHVQESGHSRTHVLLLASPLMPRSPKET